MSKIEGAEVFVLSDGVKVSSYEQYLTWQIEQLQLRGVAHRWWSNDELSMKIEYGCYIADCQRCGTAMRTHAEWKLACCAVCGAVYNNVIFPPDLDQIVSLLLVRPRRENRNWFPGDGAWRLKMDNLLHGVHTQESRHG